MSRILPKRCSKCGKRYAIEEYYRDSSKPDGYYSSCKSCNKGKDYLRVKKWRTENPVKRKEQDNRKNAIQRVKKFGFSDIGELERFYVLHNNKCDICGCTNGDRLMAIDHDHKTGMIRGLLCGKCNQAIGLFQDEPKLLKKAIKYLLEVL